MEPRSVEFRKEKVRGAHDLRAPKKGSLSPFKQATGRICSLLSLCTPPPQCTLILAKLLLSPSQQACQAMPGLFLGLCGPHRSPSFVYHHAAGVAISKALWTPGRPWEALGTQIPARVWKISFLFCSAETRLEFSDSNFTRK